MKDAPSRMDIRNSDRGLPEAWRTRSDSIPVERYISREFAELERDRFWTKTWQMACRLEQVPSIGSYVVYDILDQSIVVVRTGEATVKAYYNACPHRATQLALGSGRFQLDSIICPFHGWKWDLEGNNTFIPNRDEFKGGCLDASEVSLREVNAAVWLGFVYVSLADAPMPFEQFVAPIDEVARGIRLEDMRFHWHMVAEVNANWKIAQEAFIEAYHVPQTHPQLTGGVAHEIANSIYTYEPYEHGHGLFHSAGASAMGRLPKKMLGQMSQEEQAAVLMRSLSNLFQGHDSMVHAEEVEIARTMRKRELPPGETVGSYFQKVLREHYAAQGRPIGDVAQLARCTDMHIFPHVTFLPSFGNIVLYRVRPAKDNDPEKCIFDMYALRTYAEGQEPPKWHTQHLEGDLLDGKNWFLIPSQDFTSVLRQQRGLHARSMDALLMAGHQESLILNMHEELDRFLSEAA